MERKTKQKITGAALVASYGLFLGSAYNGCQLKDKEWTQEFKEHPAYIEIENMHEAWNKLQCAYSSLGFAPAFTDVINPNGDNEEWIISGSYILFPDKTTVPAKYPNGTRARHCLDNALVAMGDRDNLDDMIRNVRESLPEQEEIKEYNGMPVNMETFAWQNNEIQKVSHSVYEMEDTAWNKLEEARKAAKKQWGIVGGIGFLGIIGALFGLNRYKKEKDNGNLQHTGKNKKL